MKIPERNWRGLIRTFPYQPNLVLTKLLYWKRNADTRYATVCYPEPDNLTAAAAFRRIPPDLIARDAFIYKDERTGLWVQAVACRLVPPNLVQSWCQLQLDGGALAIWVNGNPKPARIQPETVNAERQEFISLLNTMDKFMLNGIDIKRLIDGIKNEYREIKPFVGWTPPVQKKYARLKPGQTQRLATKPVKTPLGIFNSVNAAAKAHGFNASKMSVTITRDTTGQYQYLSREEYGYTYAKINKNVSTEDCADKPD